MNLKLAWVGGGGLQYKRGALYSYACEFLVPSASRECVCVCKPVIHSSIDLLL